MGTKKNFLQAATAITVLLFLYTALIYFDQTFQALVITNPERLESSQSVHSEKNEADVQHLKKLGFSDIVISQMTQPEIDQYQGINGSVVDEQYIYRKVTGENEKRLSKKEYNKLLQSYSESKWAHKAGLERVQLKLVNEGNYKFLIISEHHYDYGPNRLKPLGIEVQLRSEYSLLNQTSKQIWWTTSSFKPEKIISGVEYITPSNQIQENKELGLINIVSGDSLLYSVPWKKPGLFEDVVGLHFYTATEFEVPKEYTIIDAFIQGQNPYLSAHLQHQMY
ncbi:hypothetical protein QNH39_06450 [Neobacillus novalis]|uniref:Uncharacterized protein n=1 Tax=Neobacillus novalis TaxID=220687 RepID=A0AA95MT30_9BACI|nr:hypothetical protein [Neobacillus novalis]WHY87490.1 hypothetical protein QNH39_06450 [Neobacillus novalis]